MTRTLLSDDGKTVIIIDDNENELEEIPVEEFIEEHGIDALKSIMTEAQRKIFYPEPDWLDVVEYYNAMRNVTYNNGYLAKIIGMRTGAFDGSEKAVKAVDKYFKGRDSRIASRIEASRMFYNRSMEHLSEMSKKVGLGSIPSVSDNPPKNVVTREAFSNYMFTEKGFRAKIRRKIKKYSEKGILVSLDRIVAEVLGK